MANQTKRLTEYQTTSTVNSLEVCETLKAVSELTLECVETEKTLASLKKSDPSTIAELQASCEKAAASVNMWTDNIFILRQFLSSKMSVSQSVINAEFGIDNDMDLFEN